MRRLLLIGIGVGDPDQLTLQAVRAIEEVDVFFLLDKGPEKEDLSALRVEICRRHRPDGRFRTVTIRDPERDRSPDDYRVAVKEWHEQRAAIYEDAIEDSLSEDECGAFLVWGDPSIYDSTLRIVQPIAESGRLGLEIEQIPGISSIQLLAARHRIPLNRIGEAVTITTGRKLASGQIPGEGDLVIMLDGNCSFMNMSFPADIYWGAYLGTPHELLVAGPVDEVAEQIQQLRSEARASHGWIMDIYLLRRRTELSTDGLS